MVGTHAGDMIGEIALAIEMGADAVDNGDFKDVAVIELLVKPCDTIQAEQSLITVERAYPSRRLRNRARQR
jgi:hypothetical protein